MKKILLILAALFSVGIFVVAANNEKVINKNQLPAQAQEFVNSHFEGIDLIYAKKECYIIFNSYEVRLADGSKLEFSNKGKWKEVECQSGEVPSAIIPQPIKEYVEKNYAGAKVLLIEKNRKDYEVKLSNRLELKFDKNFNIYDIDD